MFNKAEVDVLRDFLEQVIISDNVDPCWITWQDGLIERWYWVGDRFTDEEDNPKQDDELEFEDLFDLDNGESPIYKLRYMNVEFTFTEGVDDA